MSSQALRVIANPKSTEKELLSAIRSLQKRPTKPPLYWTDIANNRSFSPLHRRHVLSQLFRRHVKVGMPLQELAKVLHYPHWLQQSIFQEVRVINGYLSIDMVDGDSLYSIHFFSEPNKEQFGLYFRIHKEVSLEDLTNLFFQKNRTNIGRNIIAEIYHFPKDSDSGNDFSIQKKVNPDDFPNLFPKKRTIIGKTVLGKYTILSRRNVL